MLCALCSAAFADDLTIAARIDSKDASSDKTALALTKALRVAAKSKTSAKDFDTAVANADCGLKQPSCAASIGATLGVTHMLVGELERRGTRYTITLSLIKVSTKQRVRSLRDVAPTKVNVPRWARTLHSRMFDEGTGELVIAANVRRGQVFVDGLGVTELYEGRATLSNLALGTHEIAIRASGYKPFSVDVTIDGRSEESFLLEPVP